MPFSQITPSGSTFQILAARTLSSRIMSRTEFTTARPVAKVTRLPPVTKLKPIEAGIGDHRPHLVVIDAELLGRHQGERGAAAADVGIARDHRDRAVLADMRGGAGIGADVEPEAGRDAARIARLDRRLVVLGVLDRLQRLDHADGVEGDAVGGLGALLGGVLQAQVDRIHA